MTGLLRGRRLRPQPATQSETHSHKEYQPPILAKPSEPVLPPLHAKLSSLSPACVPCGQGGGLVRPLPRGLGRRRLHDDGLGALRPRLGGGPWLVCGIGPCALCMAAFILRRLRLRSTHRQRQGHRLAGREGRALGGRGCEGRGAVGVGMGQGVLRCRLGLLRGPRDADTWRQVKETGGWPLLSNSLSKWCVFFRYQSLYVCLKSLP